MGCRSSKGVEAPVQSSAWTLSNTIQQLIAAPNNRDAWTTFNAWTGGETNFHAFLRREGPDRVLSVFLSGLKGAGPVSPELAGLVAAVASKPASNRPPRAIDGTDYVPQMQWLQCCVDQRECLRALVSGLSSPVFSTETRVRFADSVMQILQHANELNSPEYLARGIPPAGKGRSGGDVLRRGFARSTDLWGALLSADFHAESPNVLIACMNIARTMLVVDADADGTAAEAQYTTGLGDLRPFFNLLQMRGDEGSLGRHLSGNYNVATSVTLLLHQISKLGPAATQSIAAANPFPSLLSALSSLLLPSRRVAKHHKSHSKSASHGLQSTTSDYSSDEEEEEEDEMDVLLSVKPASFSPEIIKLVIFMLHLTGQLLDLPEKQGGKAAAENFLAAQGVPIVVAALNATCVSSENNQIECSLLAVLLQSAALRILAQLAQTKSAVVSNNAAMRLLANISDRYEDDDCSDFKTNVSEYHSDVEVDAPVPKDSPQSFFRPNVTPARVAVVKPTDRRVNPMKNNITNHNAPKGTPEGGHVPPHLRGSGQPRLQTDSRSSNTTDRSEAGGARLRATVYNPSAATSGAVAAFGPISRLSFTPTPSSTSQAASTPAGQNPKAISDLLAASGFLDHPLLQREASRRLLAAASNNSLKSAEPSPPKARKRPHASTLSSGLGSPVARISQLDAPAPYPDASRPSPGSHAASSQYVDVTRMSPGSHMPSVSPVNPVTTQELLKLALWNGPMANVASSLTSAFTGLALLDAAANQPDSLASLLAQGTAVDDRVISLFLCEELPIAEGATAHFASALQRRASVVLWKISHERIAHEVSKLSRAQGVADRLNDNLLKQAATRLLEVCKAKDIELEELVTHAELVAEIVERDGGSAPSVVSSPEPASAGSMPSPIAALRAAMSGKKAAKQQEGEAAETLLAAAVDAAANMPLTLLTRISGIHFLDDPARKPDNDLCLHIFNALWERNKISPTAVSKYPDAVALLCVAAVVAEALVAGLDASGAQILPPSSPRYGACIAFIQQATVRTRDALRANDTSLERLVWTEYMLHRIVILAQSTIPDVAALASCMIISATHSRDIYGNAGSASHASAGSAVVTTPSASLPPVDNAAKRRAWLASVPHASLDLKLPDAIVAPWTTMQPALSPTDARLQFGTEWQFATSVTDGMSAAKATSFLREKNLYATLSQARAALQPANDADTTATTTSTDIRFAVVTEALVGLTVAASADAGPAPPLRSPPPKKQPVIESANPLMAALQQSQP